MVKKFASGKLNNKGAGIVSAIVAIALVSILVGLVLSMTYTNFKIKQANLNTTKNFYSAEEVLDAINVGLQGVVSDALSDAYLTILAKYNAYTPDEKNEEMEHLYYENLWRVLATDASHNSYKIEVLRGFLPEDVKWDDTDNTGALVSSTTSKMITYEDTGIVLKDIEIYFRDGKNFSTMIKTDIRLACPKLQFGAATDIPNVMNYAIVADEELVFKEDHSLAETTVTGQVYAGKITAESNAGLLKINIIDSKDTESAFTLVSKGDISLRNATLTTPDTAVLWAKSIKLDSATAVMAGTTALSNDLVLNGANSTAVISGKFAGYGNSTDKSEESSSIIINGTGASLDLSGTDIIEIAGHAFVGTGKASVDNISVGDSKFTAEQQNVLTGESIAVKSNQLLYLLPGACVGVNEVTHESRFAKNPMTQEEYKALKLPIDGNTYTDVNKDYVFFKVSENGAVREYKYSDFADEVVKVFIPSGSTTMVYYYISFRNDELANKFFQLSYSESPDTIKKYLSFYTDMIKVPKGVITRFQTAGNLLTEVQNGDGTVTTELIPNSVKNSSYFSTTTDLYTRQFKALCTKLTTNYMDFESSELEKCLTEDVVFDNLVNDKDNKFTNAVNANGGTMEFTDIDGTVRAVLTNFDYTYNNEEEKRNINLIIAKGDVTVNADFTGLILCDGTITVAPGVNIYKDDVLVKNAFKLKKPEESTINPEPVMPLSYMVDGTDIIMTDTSDAASMSLILKDLVIYENWTKNDVNE